MALFYLYVFMYAYVYIYIYIPVLLKMISRIFPVSVSMIILIIDVCRVASAHLSHPASNGFSCTRFVLR
jgi:hypothetical protein